MIFLAVALLFAEEPPAVKAEPTSQKANYDAAYTKAEKAKLPLVVYVNQEKHNIFGCVVVRWDDYPVDARQAMYGACVVVGRGGKELKVFRGQPKAQQISDFLFFNNAGRPGMPIPNC